MQQSNRQRGKRARRKWILLILCLALAGIFAYFFRAWYLPALQYQRLQSLHCNGDCTSRFWVHRVNSTERYHELKEYYTGFELDLVYDDFANDFFIYHDPRPKEQPLLSLGNFLPAIDPAHHLWLDARQVDSLNILNAIRALSRIDPAGRLKTSAIVEVYDDVAAATLTAAGYTVSFNVWPAYGKKMLTDSLFRNDARSRLENVKYVSREAEMIPTLKQLFPGKKIITWDLGLRNFVDRSDLRALLQDEDVEIILLTIESRHYM